MGADKGGDTAVARGFGGEVEVKGIQGAKAVVHTGAKVV